MKNRFACCVLLLPVVLGIAGCGGAAKPKTEDPVKIEEMRQKAIENAHKEQSTSK